jgi:hypothetical protein
VDIPGPVIGLAEFAIADDVDAGFSLLANDLGDGFAQAGVVRGLVIRPFRFDFFEE